MKKILVLTAICLLLVLTVTFCVACVRQIPNGETKPNEIPPVEVVKPNEKPPVFSRTQAEVLSTESYQNSINDFAFDLFKTLSADENACISPLSVYLAFACLSNAANGDTLSQIASAMSLEIEEINEYCNYLLNLYQDDESNAEVVKIANSVWFKESYAPKQTFIDNSFSIYDAEIIKANFDQETVRQTNEWISNKTNGLIKNMVSRYSENTILQIVNTILFENEWARPLYETRKIFKNSDSSTAFVKGGTRTLSTYYESNGAEAFKYGFENPRFSFVGIRPKGDIEEYLANFDAKEYNALMSNAKNDFDKVETFVPFFNFDYEKSLKDSLTSMGIVNAFNPIVADFSNGWDNADGIYVSFVKHKTHFELSKDGVRAAAATIIGMDATSVGPGYQPTIKYLELDKPFIYMIVDNEYNVPLFIGNVKTLTQA